MEKEKRYELIREYLIYNFRFIDLFNELLADCENSQLINEYFPTDKNLMIIEKYHLDNRERAALLEIAAEVCLFSDNNSIKKLLEFVDEEHIFKVGKTLFDYGIINDYILKYPYITRLSVASSNETSEESYFEIEFTEGVNRIRLSQYEEKYSPSMIASTILWCLAGVPKDIIMDVSADYFLSEAAKTRLINGESKIEIVRIRLNAESKDVSFGESGALGTFKFKEGKIISDYYPDPRRDETVDNLFKGLWDNALINKYGVCHGNIDDVIACAKNNRYPILIDMSEIGNDEKNIKDILALNNQIIIWED